MSTMHSKRALLAVLVAVLFPLVTAGQAVAAKKAPKPEPTASSLSAPGLTPAAVEAGRKAKGRAPTAEEALAAYWTADRMKEAVSADDAPAIDDAKKAHKDKAAKDEAAARDASEHGGKAQPTGPAGKVGPQTALDASPANSTLATAAYLPGYPYYSFTARTAGKVFFTDTSDGLNYVCSGTVVNSEGKRLVWTAGHCVHHGPGGSWHANWVFVPSYSYGWAPYGQWTASQLWSMTGWMNSGDFASDMGVAVMNLRYGWRIVDYLGGQGITWNQSKHIGVTAFGYPAASPFDGGALWACGGTTFPEWEFLWWSAETLGLTCDMTGGSSGGGWLAFFNGSSGYVNGNNSYKYDSDPNHMYSPYFDGTTSSLYNATRYL